MYQATECRRREDELGAFGRGIEVEDPTTHARCQASAFILS